MRPLPIPDPSRRTGRYLQQVGLAAAFKLGSMLATLGAIPLMIHYLGSERFGIWSTLLTLVSWTVFFDLGLGSGLRAALSERFAMERRADAANLISAGYSLIAVLASSIWLAAMAASFLIEWQEVFNSTDVDEGSLRLTVQITATATLINFATSLIGAVLASVQRTSLSAFAQLLSTGMAFVTVFGLSKSGAASLPLLATLYGAALVSGNVALTIGYFRRHRDLRPRWSFDRRQLGPIVGTGVQYFAVQLAALMIFATDKILITQFFGPAEVTAYEIAFRLFGIVTIGHALLTTPLWSAYADAFHRDDLGWLRTMLRRQMRTLLPFGVLIAGLLVLSNPLVRLWIGDDATVDGRLAWAMAFLAALSIWNNVFGSVLAGIGKVRMESIYAIGLAIVNVPLAYVFAVKLEFGVPGIVAAAATCIGLSSLLAPLRVYYFVFSPRRSPWLDAILR